MEESFIDRVRDSIGYKLASMGIITLLLLIPLALVAERINDRSKTRDEVSNEISQEWSGRQTVVGPVLVVPFEETRGTDTAEMRTVLRHAFFLPDELSIAGAVDSETRYRGPYEVIVYSTDLEFEGEFSPPDFSSWSVPDEAIRWDEAFLAVGITDMRGIEEAISLEWSGEEHVFTSGMGEASRILPSGVNIPVDAQVASAFSFDMSLSGSRALQFVPVGKSTNVTLESAWPSPSFNGAFLPDERIITDEGFDATWQVLDLNRPYGQQWRDQTHDLLESSFGVSLEVPVDHYRKSLRATRYAVLVIVLTLLAFFLIELRFSMRAHPFQYVLVGLGLCLFYLLLLSLGEHMLFSLAYLVAGVATTGLISLYVVAVFRKRQLGLVTGGVLAVLHVFIYLLLQLEDYALLAGSIGLFVLLAITMYMTRSFAFRGSGALIPSEAAQSTAVD